MEPLVIMALVLFEVALWQWRVAITVRGNSSGGALLGFIGALVQVTAIARVVQNVGDIANVVAYASGVGIGVLVGCLVDRRLSAREVTVRVFAPADPERSPSCAPAAGPSPPRAGTGTRVLSTCCTSPSTSARPPRWSTSWPHSLPTRAGPSNG